MTKKKEELTPRQPGHVKLAVIPEPAPYSRAVMMSQEVINAGPGKLVMDCGACGVPLLQGVAVSEVRTVVVKCPTCGAFNEVLD